MSYWNMPCWEGLSPQQQGMLIEEGYLPIGYRPNGPCKQGAMCEITTQDDDAPGPRFYCYAHGAEYLRRRWEDKDG